MAFRRRKKKIAAKTPEELDQMERAGAIVGNALVAVKEAAKPGVSLLELNAVAERVIRNAGATPTFLGYGGFPASICASRNDVVVHGIPTSEEIVEAGDYISIDCGATLNGWGGDSAWSFGIGETGALQGDELPDDPESAAGGSLRSLDKATQDVLAAAYAPWCREPISQTYLTPWKRPHARLKRNTASHWGLSMAMAGTESATKCMKILISRTRAQQAAAH